MKAPKCTCYDYELCALHREETSEKLANALNALVEGLESATSLPHAEMEALHIVARAALELAGYTEGDPDSPGTGA